jgi:hypothetical protein
MRVAQIGILKRRGFSAEYQAVLDRATALGYTQPSPDQKAKQNKLVQSLKDAGIWDLLDVFYVFATDGDSDFATLNWKAPSANQATKVNTPTFTSNQGFTGNGTSSYLNTNFTPSTQGVNYTTNAASFFLHENTNVASNGTNSVYSDTSANALLITPRSSVNEFRAALNSSAQAVIAGSVTDSQGLHLMNRTTSAVIQGYKNGIQIGGGDIALTASGRPSLSLFLLARNSNGTVDFPRPAQISMAGLGGNLSALQSDLYTAWKTYFTSL